MFKSIDYKLYFYIFLLIITVSTTTYFLGEKQYVMGGFSIFLIIIELYQLYKHYNKYNKNIVFLLNALDNGDYAFHFSTTRLSRRERELNKMMNRIKEILSKAREEVIENEKFLSLILEQVPTGIIILDEKHNVRGCNQTASKLLGLPIFTHINQLKIVDKALPQLFKNLRDQTENQQIKITTEIEEIQILIKVSSITIKQKELRIISLNNIADELDAKEMDSWIKLIRVMTHEIMNSVAPISSLAEMLLTEYQTTKPNDEKRLKINTVDSLQTIHDTAKELIAFVSSYRAFSQVTTPQISHIQLKPFIQSVINLEEAELTKNKIHLILKVSKDETIQADQSLLSRVLINLIKNSIEALDGKQEKTIQISATSTEDNVQIDIADNGNPVPADMVNDIFVPFFTTKRTGSGIGLSVSRYILRLQNGTLKHSYHEGWTLFSILLPKPKNKLKNVSSGYSSKEI